MQIHFVLVEPFVPENIGAAARAIKTMGFTSLRLVNPCDYLSDKAQMLAHGSVDILKKAQVFSSLEEALHDCDFIIGTTAKQRLAKNDCHIVGDIPDIIRRKTESADNTALVFGRESKGLLNTELRLCDILSTIPMKTRYPSLNLAQTVMLYAYTLSPLVLERKEPRTGPADAKEFHHFKQVLGRLMKKVKVKPLVHNRLMERICLLGDNDIHLLYSLCNKLNEHLKEK
jgi:tRNA/rRNA methyltransferase